MESVIAELGAFFAVILIDLALSADNAVAVGLAAAALPERQRRGAVFWGVVLALLLRIGFGLVTVELLHVSGVLLVGGLALFWIAFRMAGDLAAHRAVSAGEGRLGADGDKALKEPTFARALTSIVIANIALSLDNVLAVAGVARNAPAIMAFGLVLSVLLMGVAAAWIARMIDRYRWIGHLGIAAIVLAGVVMVWDDLCRFFPANVPPPPEWLGGHAVLPP